MPRLTEDQVERSVEQKIDTLDKWFLRGDLTREQYDRAVANVDRWAAEQLATPDEVAQ